METVSRRRLVKTGTLSAGILLILALLGIVNYFSSKYYKRFDWTGSHKYTLSPKSREGLRHLGRDVDGVMPVSGDPTSPAIYEPTRVPLAGHGEPSLDDTGQRGLSSSREILGRDNFEMEGWASLGKPAVPPKTDLVVIAGPTGSFLQPELNAFTAYVRSGGRMLILLDPTL